MTSNMILWERLDQPGHESARLYEHRDGYELTGSAVFIEDALPVRLDYTIRCGRDWRTERAAVRGWVGTNAVDIAIAAEAGRWQMNGAQVAAVDGCIDVDLNFSPSTNLLPVRRLGLTIGQSALVRAAWLRFPSFRLELFEQTYRRLAADIYEYESSNFKATIRVNAAGLPLEYAGVWRAIASADDDPASP